MERILSFELWMSEYWMYWHSCWIVPMYNLVKFGCMKWFYSASTRMVSLLSLRVSQSVGFDIQKIAAWFVSDHFLSLSTKKIWVDIPHNEHAQVADFTVRAVASKPQCCRCYWALIWMENGKRKAVFWVVRGFKFGLTSSTWVIILLIKVPI